MDLENFVRMVVRELVDYPDEILVEKHKDDMGVLITLNVAKEDMGKIIGREGETAKALRSLLRSVGMRNNARVSLKINEPYNPEREPGSNVILRRVGDQVA